MTETQQSKNWWVFPHIPPESEEALSGYVPFMRQILYNRKIVDADTAAQYLDGMALDEDPFDLLDMDVAVDRLLHAADHHESVAVYGDYDVDGVTATALMVEALSRLGIEAHRYIPNRFEEGYGLNMDAVQLLADSGVTLIVTVDCGIRSPREAEFARSLGVDMIISDHHMPKHELPDSLAVICPKREGDPYICKDLSGVGLAYKIAQALLIKRPVNGVSVDDWLDLVALGTVSDIVPLTGENRSLVKRGLKRIHLGRRMGLASLLRVARRDPAQVTSGDIGFILGPRLNAAGRMDSALQAYQLLVSSDMLEVGTIAQKLDNQNSERQDLTKELQAWVADRMGSIDGRFLISDFSLADFDYSAYSTKSGSGIMGLVASKLVESYYRPAVIGTIEEGVIKASCRSIPEFHITRALDECSDLLVRHGGHSMAAGFTVAIENRDALVERLHQIAQRELAAVDLRHTLKADMELPIEGLPRDAITLLKQLEPTGMENPEARFISRNVDVQDPRRIGKDQNHLKFKVRFQGGAIDAVAWRQAAWLDLMPGKFDLFYSIEENNYNNRSTMQLNVRDIKPSEPSPDTAL